MVADTTKKTKSNALAIKAAFDSLNQIIKIMHRAFLNLMQSSETIKDEDKNFNSGSEAASKGIVSLMESTVKLFDLGISPKTYKVCISCLSSKVYGVLNSYYLISEKCLT